MHAWREACDGSRVSCSKSPGSFSGRFLPSDLVLLVEVSEQACKASGCGRPVGTKRFVCGGQGWSRV